MKTAEKIVFEKRTTNGRVFQAWWQCSLCSRQVFFQDRYCRECGAKFK